MTRNNGDGDNENNSNSNNKNKIMAKDIRNNSKKI